MPPLVYRIYSRSNDSKATAKPIQMYEDLDTAIWQFNYAHLIR